jgi:putative intracellular protease/amidase
LQKEVDEQRNQSIPIFDMSAFDVDAILSFTRTEVKMSHYRSIGLLVVLLIVIAGCVPISTPTPIPAIEPPTAAPLTVTPKVLLIVREGGIQPELMLTKEVNVMLDMLEKAGLKVLVATDSGQPIAGSTTTLKPDLKLSDVKVEDYAGVILPCMAAGSAPDSDRIPPDAVEIVKKAVVQGKPVAAQDSAIEILLKAGVLGGKQFANKGMGAVQDGNIITAGSCPYLAETPGNPDTTTELTQEFIDTIATVK